jgi:pimeloyl-ACP methyl ester carboxylesterase
MAYEHRSHRVAGGAGVALHVGETGNPSVWAADIPAVVTDLALERPILCGWSYGVVVADYLRSHGEGAVGGIVLVGAISRLGEPVLPFLGGDFVATLPGLFSTDVETSTAACRRSCA